MDSNEIEYIVELEKEVDEIRKAALEKVQRTHPEIKFVIDRRTIDDYCYKTWDYPGKWYYSGFKLPKEFRTKDELIDAIVNDTIRHFCK